MIFPVAVDEMRAEDELSLPSSATTWGGEAYEEVRFGRVRSGLNDPADVGRGFRRHLPGQVIAGNPRAFHERP